MTIIKKMISNFTTLVMYLILILMVFIVISSKASGGEPQLFSYQLKTVFTGSMEPGIKTGSIIAVKFGGDMTRFNKGDIITFKMNESRLVTHRITRVNKSGNQVTYRTKGDNNNTEDINPVLSQNVVAKYTGFTIPYLGYIITFVNQKNGAFLLIAPGILLVIYSIISIWKSISMIDEKTKSKFHSI